MLFLKRLENKLRALFLVAYALSLFEFHEKSNSDHCFVTFFFFNFVVCSFVFLNVAFYNRPRRLCTILYFYFFVFYFRTVSSIFSLEHLSIVESFYS